jgi:hypothetical protein
MITDAPAGPLQNLFTMRPDTITPHLAGRAEDLAPSDVVYNRAIVERFPVAVFEIKLATDMLHGELIVFDAFELCNFDHVIDVLRKIHVQNHRSRHGVYGKKLAVFLFARASNGAPDSCAITAECPNHFFVLCAVIWCFRIAIHDFFPIIISGLILNALSRVHTVHWSMVQ